MTEATRKPDAWAGAAAGMTSPLIESLMFKEAIEEGYGLGEVPLASFLAEVDMRKFWSYEGSLTRPPCTEGIKWHVIEEVQKISEKQLEEFTKYYSDNMSFANGNGNNRAIQELNDRTLYYVDDYTRWDWFKEGSGAATLVAGAALTLFTLF